MPTPKSTLKRTIITLTPVSSFFAGIWQSSVGAKSVNYIEEEVCVILEDRVRLTDLNGNTKEFGAGIIFALQLVLKSLGKHWKLLKKCMLFGKANNILTTCSNQPSKPTQLII